MMKRVFLLFFSCIFICLEATPPQEQRPTICLNMIVKNESKVIRRCLDSLKGIIDYWVIVDTGSTDGTQQIIEEFLKDVPGELYERPWVNFGYNRNQAVQLAKNKGDYLLFIDADERLELPKKFVMPKLDEDCYIANLKSDRTVWKRMLLVNNHLDWKWEGVIHEYPMCSMSKPPAILKGISINCDAQDGYRTLDYKKHQKDIQALEKAIEDEPLNSRYVFYLAQTQVMDKEYVSALKNYEKCASMEEGASEQFFWSLHMIGELRELLKMPEEVVIESYWEAYYARPTRAESLFRLAHYYSKIKKYEEGYLLAQFGLSIVPPDDYINVLPWVYDYGFLCVLAECAFYLGEVEEAETTLYKILANPDVVPETRRQAQRSFRILKKKQSS